MRVEIFPFGHVFREGSQVRVTVAAPHVHPDLWGFTALPVPAQNTIHTGGLTAVSVVLPLVAGESRRRPRAAGVRRHLHAAQPALPRRRVGPGAPAGSGICCPTRLACRTPDVRIGRSSGDRTPSCLGLSRRARLTSRLIRSASSRSACVTASRTCVHSVKRQRRTDPLDLGVVVELGLDGRDLAQQRVGVPHDHVEPQPAGVAGPPGQRRQDGRDLRLRQDPVARAHDARLPDRRCPVPRSP